MRMTPPIDRLPTARARGRRKVVSDSNYQHLPRVRGRVGVGRGVSITSIPSLVATPIPAFPRKRGKG